MTPSGRSLVGIFILIALIAVYGVGIAILSPLLDPLPVLARMAVYLVLGLAWILPAAPIVRWIVSGRFGRMN